MMVCTKPQEQSFQVVFGGGVLTCVYEEIDAQWKQ